MTMRHICSLQHQFTAEMIGTEETPYGVCFHCGRLALGEETALAFVYGVLCGLHMQDPQASDHGTLPEQGGMVLHPRRNCQAFCRTHRRLTTVNTGRIVFQISCFTERSARY